MKASLAVIAALFVSPAYASENAFENRYPAWLTDKATSWSDVQLTNSPCIPVDFGPRTWDRRSGAKSKLIHCSTTIVQRCATLVLVGYANCNGRLQFACSAIIVQSCVTLVVVEYAH